MSPEQLAAEDVLEQRGRFHTSYQKLRSRNKELAEKQRQLRLRRKPSRGLENKDPHTALEITVILRLMLEVRGKILFQTQARCPLCRSRHDLKKPREIHALPRDEWGRQKAARISLRIITELGLDEFIILAA